MLFRKFRNDQRGNILPIFALAIIPVIGFVGAAVDYSRAAALRTSMQAALDATALYLSKDAPNFTPEQLSEKGTAYFKALFHHSEAKNLVVSSAYSATTGGWSVKVTANASVDTTLARVLGQKSVDIGVNAEAVWGINRRLELALALDNTGSMASNNKMTELKKAAKDLLTTLQAAAKKPDDIKVSVIPFAYDVNIGTSNAGATWLDWTDWEAPPPNSMPASDDGPGSNCPYSTSNQGYRCTSGPANGSSITSNIPSSGSYKGYICPSSQRGRYYNGCYNSVPTTTTTTKTVGTGGSANCNGYSNCTCSGSGSSKVCTQTNITVGAPYTHTWIVNARSTWNGCVTDRSKDYDVLDTAPSSQVTNFVPQQATSCPVDLLSLTNSWSTLNTKIDNMTPVGNTNVTIGLVWGWHSITPGAPLTQGSAKAQDLDKVIILLTDGDNTQNRWSTTAADIDVRTKKACDNIKADGVKIYTIRVIDGNANLLRSCATDPSMYFDVQNASQLSGVFSQIAKNLANLRLAK